MKEDPRATLKHQLDHAIPTVIHHPEENLPLLARWLHYATEDRGRFFTFLGIVLVAVVGMTILSSGLSVRRATTDEAWTELQTAKTAAEREKIAEKYPNTPAGRWALLQAATDFYNKGFADLPANRDVALPDLKKALGLFDKVLEQSPKDSAQARAAALGKARTLEARNEIDKAIAQYEYVAKTWPDTDEAQQSKQQAQLLRHPDSVAFYKELYAYKPTETTIPPLGEGSLNFPLGTPLQGEGSSSPFSFTPPPPPTPATTPKTESPVNPELPTNVFSPDTNAAPKEKGAKSELPQDVFSPAPAATQDGKEKAAKP